jgi:hypothetical protein
MKKLIGMFLGFSLVLSACKKDEASGDGVGNFQLRLYPTFEGQAFETGEIYRDVLGHRIRVDDFKLYISNAALLKTDGTTLPLIDIDLFTLQTAQSIKFEVPAGDYAGLLVSFGVPEESNKDQDPTQYPNDHPLSVAGAQGMFWGWNTGYIFMKFEGKADTLGVDGNEMLHPFAFHCGEDVLYRSHDFNVPFNVGDDGTSCMDLRFAVDRFFYSASDTIDIKVNYLTHTSGNLPLAVRFTDLFNAAVSFE